MPPEGRATTNARVVHDAMACLYSSPLRGLDCYLEIELFGGTVGRTPEDARICWKRQRNAG